jgi:flavin reductase (DIM6/NTAB) family NADH-FMN oxidoreductase RutF
MLGSESLTALGRTVRPPHVAEAAFSMECSLVHWYEVKTDEGKLANTVVLGRVKRFQAVSPAQKPAHWLGA